MSGHSKWSKIKRQKGANDTKRGALFTKLAKLISLASQSGSDPDMNFALRLAIDKAKQANMPLINIERAVKKGAGLLEGGTIQQVRYEGVGPKGSAFIVLCNTDNTNRTVSEIRKIFESVGGIMQNSGNVLWKFDEMGAIEIKAQKVKKAEKYGKSDEIVDIDKEQLQFELMDLENIVDIQIGTIDDDYDLIVLTKRELLAQVHKKLEEQNLVIVSAQLKFIPKDLLNLSEEDQTKVLNLMERFDDHDDVDSVYCDVNLD